MKFLLIFGNLEFVVFGEHLIRYRKTFQKIGKSKINGFGILPHCGALVLRTLLQKSVALMFEQLEVIYGSIFIMTSGKNGRKFYRFFFVLLDSELCFLFTINKSICRHLKLNIAVILTKACYYKLISPKNI